MTNKELREKIASLEIKLAEVEEKSARLEAKLEEVKKKMFEWVYYPQVIKEV